MPNLAANPFIGYEIAAFKLEGLTVRGRRAVFQAANFEMAYLWQDKYKAMHFTRRAMSRYGYKLRNPKYEARKRRLARAGIVKDGGEIPLVFSGDLREAVMAWSPIRATPKFSIIRLSGPSYFRIRYRGASRVNLGQEVTRVIPSEGERLAQAALEAADRAIENNPRRRRVSVKRKSKTVSTS